MPRCPPRDGAFRTGRVGAPPLYPPEKSRTSHGFEGTVMRIRILLLAAFLLLPSLAHAQWSINGVPVCVQPNTQTNVFAASDGAGGAILVWEDARNLAIPQITAQ